MNKIWLLSGVFLLSACAGSSDRPDAESYTAYFSDPVCKTYEYSEPITENDGDQRTKKFGNAYCTYEDYIHPESSETLNPAFIEVPLNNIFENLELDIQRIDVASYFYSYQTLTELICNRAKTDDFSVRLFAQATANKTTNFASPSDITKLRECLGEDKFQLIAVGCDVFDDAAKCKRKNINTAHIKFLTIQGNQSGKPISHVFGGSANLRNRMSMDYDDMLHFVVSQASPINITHQCMADVMEQTTKNRWKEAASVAFYKKCVKQLDRGNKVPARAYFSPPEGGAFLNRLLRSIDKADQVRVAVQVLGIKELRDALIRAAERGADVRVIADNGWYYLTFGESFTHREEFDWGEKDSQNFEHFFRPIMNSKAKTRFLETNFDLSRKDNNYMHLRFVITSKDNRHIVFTGSSHFKLGALLSNYENQYVITDQPLANGYVRHFDGLWKRSLSSPDLPSRYVPSQYALEASKKM